MFSVSLGAILTSKRNWRYFLEWSIMFVELLAPALVHLLTLYTLISKLRFSFTVPIQFNRSIGENLVKYQMDSSSLIMYSILTTTMFSKALILWGEISCSSLLGLKGLKKIKMESIRKLSNFNFQWTKTVYQNNVKHIAFFFPLFKSYGCKK